MGRPPFYLGAWLLVLLVSTPLVRLELASTALAPATARPAMWRIVVATGTGDHSAFIVMRTALDTANAHGGWWWPWLS
ncbi:tellurite resistance protein TehA-like permease [Arthrobacter sp. 2762]